MWAPGYDRKENFNTSQRITNGLNRSLMVGSAEGIKHTGLPGTGDKHTSQDIITASLMIRPVLSRYAVPNIPEVNTVLNLGG